MLRIIFILGVSYLLGSIPFGYLLVRVFRGEDVRRSGSGNIGATNVSRKSPALGVMTLLLDGAKGFVAVQLAGTFSGFPPGNVHLQRAMAAASLFAIIGHMFPLWLRFHGGKGVATALGAFVRFAPQAVLIAVIIFVVVTVVSRRISLGSILTAMLFPSIVCMMELSKDPGVLALIGTAALLIIVRHHENIRRLLSGEEPKFSLGRK
jgi:glycerol-3-phosphate acyltransferase PlsY